MKRLLLTYFGCMAVIFILPVTLAMISPSNSTDAEKSAPPQEESSLLPKEINVYFKNEGVTRAIELEEYIKGVLPAEMPATFEPETLRAQAVAARTYAYYKYTNYVKNPSAASAEHPDAVICTDSTHCNAYYSPQQLLEKHSQAWIDENLERMRSYVDETKGEIMVYDEEPILAAFHSASAGGATEASGDVWGKQLPYLVNVKTIGEDQKENYVTTVVVAKDEFKNKITSNFGEAKFSDNTDNWIGKITHTGANHVKTAVIGGVEVKGTQLRTMFGLKSTYFDISADDKNITFSVKGSGHGVGMSQYGANYMAQKGSNYKEILESYYTGAKVVKY